MGKMVEQLKRQAAKKHLTGERRDAYVYGTEQRIKKARAAKRRRQGR